MTQSAIIRACYETIHKNVSNLGNETKLFEVQDSVLENPTSGPETKVYVGISDVCQVCVDKNGETIEVDDSLYEAPAQVGCILFLTVMSSFYPSLLETVGVLIQYFKDHNVILVEDYKWHGEDKGKVVLEPIIRKPEPHTISQFHNSPVISLEFYMEMGINSLEGTSFKRVEKREYRSNVIKD